MPLSLRPLWFFICLLTLLVVLVFQTPHSTKAQPLVPVTRDPNFGGTGISEILHVPDAYYVTDLQLLPSQEMLATIEENRTQVTNENFIVVRYFADGSPDLDFGTNGAAVLDFAGQVDISTVLATTSEGKIWVGGYSNNDFAIARLLPNGAIDTNFSIDGRLIISGTSTLDSIRAIGILPDDKVLLLGNSESPPYTTIIQLLSDGTLDSTFGVNGKVVLNNRYYQDLERLEDGRFLIGGSISGGNSVITRYLPNGVVDTGFGINGDVILTFEDDSSVTDIELTSAGKILFTTQEQGSAFLGRLLSYGVLDTTFNGSGLREFSDLYLISKAISLPEGGIAVLFDANALVAKVLENGEMDTTFGDEGATFVSVSSKGGIVHTLEGNFIVGGLGYGSPIATLSSVRHSGYTNTDFGETGYARIQHSISTEGNLAILQEELTKDFMVLTYDRFGGRLTRLSSEGIIDVNFGDYGSYKFEHWNSFPIPFDIHPMDMTIDSEGRILVTGYNTSINAFVARFLPTGELDSSFGDGNGIWWQEISNRVSP
jgi:uncharacterized delta-60 repeat protein